MNWKVSRINDLLLKEQRCESTRLAPNRHVRESWTDESTNSRALFKMELEREISDKYHKMEFESTFGSENDAAVFTGINTFPLPLNADFEFDCYMMVSNHYFTSHMI